MDKCNVHLSSVNLQPNYKLICLAKWILIYIIQFVTSIKTGSNQTCLANNDLKIMPIKICSGCRPHS